MDHVRLGVPGWKMRYYTSKFTVREEADVPEHISKIKQSYLEGLQWVLLYYYRGVQSWDWYYPFHYAPFSSDLVECALTKIEFELG